MFFPTPRNTFTTAKVPTGCSAPALTFIPPLEVDPPLAMEEEEVPFLHPHVTLTTMTTMGADMEGFWNIPL